MIQLKNLTLRRGVKVVLKDATVTLNPGEKVGLVGRNGAGKSSLFSLIAGRLQADAGDFDMPAKWRLGQVAQDMPETEQPATDFVLDGDLPLVEARAKLAAAEAAEDGNAIGDAYVELEHAGAFDAPARAQALLLGLGFRTDQLDAPVNSFSGGWRMRLQLARALMCPADLLLLDEPTNHLDLDALVWLENWLKRYEGLMIVISHDREFLDAITNVTVHLDNGGLTRYGANYSGFEAMRAERMEQAQAAFSKQQEKIAHLQKFIDRFKAKASKAKQAQSRMKRLAKLAGTEAVRAEREFRIEFPQPLRLPHALMRLNDADCGYGTDAVILHNVGFGLEAGDRIGLLGANGAGKSTLVKTLVGELPLIAGERYAHPDLRIGYFAQHTVESLVSGTSPLDHLRELAPDLANQVLRDFLGKWYFPGERAFENIDSFSGGEKARLALALIAWRQPNVLLLDEPTNHLDLDMREALAEALSDFDGAIVMVSHDRHLIGLVCDNYVRVSDGVVEPFDGDLDEYAAWLRTRASSDPKKAAAKQVEAAPQPVAAPVSAPAKKGPKLNPQKLAKAEARVAELEARLAQIETELAAPSAYADGGKRATDLGREQQTLRGQLEAAEAELLALYE